MTEYKFENAVVRFHGTPPPKEFLEKVCRDFVRGVMKDGNKVVSSSDKSFEGNEKLQ